MARSTEDRSLGDLFADLSAEFTALMRQELTLAKIELSDKVSRMGRDAAFLAVGGAVAYAGFLALLAALIIGLGLVIGSYLAAAFVIAVVVLGVGYFFIQQGLANLKREDVAPRQTLDTLKTNVDWAKDQIK